MPRRHKFRDVVKGLQNTRPRLRPKVSLMGRSFKKAYWHFSHARILCKVITGECPHGSYDDAVRVRRHYIEGNLWPIARRLWVGGRGGCQHPLVQSILVYYEAQMYDADDETDDGEGQGNMADFERASSFPLLNFLLQSLRLHSFGLSSKETVGLLGVWVLLVL